MSTPLLLVLAGHCGVSLRRLFADARKEAEEGGEGERKYAPVVGVTVGWILLYYAFLFRQSARAFELLSKSTKQAKPPGMNAIKYGTAGGSVILDWAVSKATKITGLQVW